jgi:hypothetical protein
VFGTCLGSVWDLFGAFLDMFRTCLGHVWDMFGTCLGHVWDMFGTCFGEKKNLLIWHRAVKIEKVDL